MSSSCIAYCFDTFTTHCQNTDCCDALKEFLCDDLGYKPFLPRELYQEHNWLLDEGALADWLTEYLNDHVSDHEDLVDAIVQGAFECPTAEDRKVLVNQCLKWLKDYKPMAGIRAEIIKDLQEKRVAEYTFPKTVVGKKCEKCGITWHDGVCCEDDCDKRLKKIVLTETTVATSTLLSLKTELADAQRELNKRTYELATLQSEYNSFKRESKRIAEDYLALAAKLNK